MAISEALIAELEREGKSTERILGRVPAEKAGWRPHAKSMTLGELAWHIARLPLGAVEGLRSGKRDTAVSRPSAQMGSDFVGEFRRNLDALKNELSSTSDAALMNERFSFMKGDQTLTSFPKLGFVRTVMMNHSIHHRGQLTVYLRLLDLPVPAMYGRSADESAFGD